MELERALAFAAGRRNTLLTTLRADGRPQQSVVFYLLDGDRFTFSLTDNRAKVKNLRRDPRAALFVPSDDVFVWAGFDGLGHCVTVRGANRSHITAFGPDRRHGRAVLSEMGQVSSVV